MIEGFKYYKQIVVVNMNMLVTVINISTDQQ